jgi:hypothetical protein
MNRKKKNDPYRKKSQYKPKANKGPRKKFRLRDLDVKDDD